MWWSRMGLESTVKPSAWESLSGFFSMTSNFSATQSRPETTIKVLQNLSILAIHRHPIVFTHLPKGENVVM